jgi:outer membrane DcaP-like protein
MRIRRAHTASCFISLLLFVSPPLKAEHGSRLDLSIGGRVKVDAIYNANSLGGIRTSKSDLAFSPTSIPVPDTGRNSLDANIRESRVWATLHLPVGKNSLSTYIEFDFFDTKKDASGRSHVANEPRLRHLYSTFRNLTIGKTYTTFANLTSYPEINDNNGPVGNLLIRQELIRYNTSHSWGESFLAVEKAESTFSLTSGSSFQVNDDQIPDIIGKIKISDSWGNLSIAGIVRDINADGQVITGTNDRQWGAAFSIAGRLYTSSQDNLRFAFSYGNALGRYASFNAFNDMIIDNNGKINLTEIIGTHLAYQHWWTTSLRSSLAVGAAYADQGISTVPATINKVFASSHINLLWSPIRKMTLGLEWLHGYRELENGNDGHLDRLQFSAIYKF